MKSRGVEHRNTTRQQWDGASNVPHGMVAKESRYVVSIEERLIVLTKVP